MKHILATCFLFLVASLLCAQQRFNSPERRYLDSMFRKREAVHRTNMVVLASWAGANLIASGIATGNSSGSDHYFHQMNVYWNIANAGIAALGLLSGKRFTEAASWGKTLKEQHKIETIVAVNGGLDLGYIMAGFYLKERGRRRANDKLTGYGNSLLLQGGFLLAFDGFQYIRHRRNGKNLENSVDKWQLGTSANGVAMTYHF